MFCMKCIKHTMGVDRYPTRATYNGPYNPNTYFINVGDIMEITDMMPDDGEVICKIGTIYSPNGTTTNVLNGRWFMFDKDYFE